MTTTQRTISADIGSGSFPIADHVGAVSPAGPDLDKVRRQIDEALDDFVDRAGSGLDDIGPELADVTRAIRQFVVGGKRMRPLFTFAGWLGAGGGAADEVAGNAVAAEAVVRAAASLELVQVAALVHDDIIDNSDSRRGRPSVHVAFTDRHDTAGWVGPSTAFGVAAGILVGDLGLIWADLMLAEAGLPPDAFVAVRRVFDTMRNEVIAGQYLDVRSTVDPSSGAEGVVAALRVARLKSASYTVARPVQMGGVMGGASEAVLAAYADYGLGLGEAFQLRDDMLGVFGDPQRTGKPAGDDIREGKRTALLAMTELHSPGDADRRLLARVGEPDLSETEVVAVAELMHSSGAVAEIETLIEQRTASACDALGRVELAPSGRATLERLATAATVRTT